MTKIAVIGLGCRFAGSSNTPSQFFDNLLNGKDCIVDTPKDRWNLDFYQDDDKNRLGKLVPRRGGFMDAIYDFDNEAFNMSAKEAMHIDAQQRILLEVAHQALLDSKIAYRGSKTGVFVGAGSSDFTEIAASNPYYANEYTATGGSMAIVSNRLSFSFDLHGPSMSVDTACSSSGSALLVAVRCLEKGDCEQALVAGISVLQNQNMTIGFTKLGVLSPDCKSKSFDASADGYVRSEGCGVVVLKPLDKAIKDGNHVYMTIDAIKCNEDGAQSPSLTMPSSEAQEKLIRETLNDYKINPNDIFFVEAHATGTPVGDPVEANAIGRVVAVERSEPVRLGSVKPNIGHSEFASCVASLIKCAMMMENGELVPNIHFKEPNPKIQFDSFKMVVQTKSEKFDRDGKLMMVSSFGFGGANCCIIVGPPPKEANQNSDNSLHRLTNPPFVFMASALSKNALTKNIENLKQLEGDQHNLMYALNTNSHTCSKFLSYGTGETLKDAKFVDPIKISNKRPVVFVFSGQGPQNFAMGRQLYKNFPKFKEVIDECDRLYVKYSGVSVINDMCLFGDKVGDKNSVHKIEVTLPGLIFIQIGLFELWKSFGVIPDAIIGHSFGEMCAIYATNAVSLEDIIRVTIARSVLMKQLGSCGTMIALGCNHQVALDMIKEGNLEQIWIAAINSPESVTLGGILDSVQKIGAMCTQKGIFNRQLNVTNAFHTPLLAPLKEKAEDMFKGITTESKLPEIPIISTVTGKVWNLPFNYVYFWENIENKVLFLDAVNEALRMFGNETVFLEMAPHPVLSISLKQSGVQNMVYSQHREENQQTSLLQACAKMTANGIPLNWDKIIGRPTQSVSLPAYPYQRKKYFFENDFHRELRLPTQFGTMLGMKIIHHSNTFQNFISTKTYNWLQDHVVQRSTIFPAAGYVELILEAVGNRGSNIVIKNPLLVPDDSLTLLQTSIKPGNCAEIFSKREGENNWTLHATGHKNETGAASTSEHTPEKQQELIEAIKLRCNNILIHEEVYKRFNVMNLDYGHFFQLIETLHQGDEESLGVLNTSRLKDKEKYVIHPAILDCCFQSFIGAIQSSAHTYLPTSIESIEAVRAPTDEKLFAYCNLKSITEKDITGDITVFGTTGDVVITVRDFTCTKVANPKFNTQYYQVTKWQAKAFPDQKLTRSSEMQEAQKQWGEVMAKKDIYGQAIAHYISKLPSSLFENNELPLFTRRHLAWCKNFAEKQKVNPESVTLMDTIPHFEHEAKCVIRAGNHLEELIHNKDNAVSRIMFSDDMIASLYQVGVSSLPAMDMYVDLFSQLKIGEDRVFRILEVGAGTGTMAKRILPLLQQYNNRVEYYFTDVSASFFVQEKRMKEYTFVQYKVIDITKPLAPQGIDDCSIDLIVGFDVIHTASNLTTSMKNLSRALVPNGLLFVVEPTIMEPYMHFIFGIFREWWGFEDDRTTCCISDSQWKELLPLCGFKDLEIFKLTEDHVHSILMARKIDQPFEVSAPPATPVVYQDGNVYSLLELVQAKIANNDNAPLIVVSEDAQVECSKPDQATLVGFARVVANEQTSWIVRSVDFPSSMKADERQKWIQTISQDLSSYETEIAIRDNQVYVPRLKYVQVGSDSKSKKQTQAPFRLEASDGLLDNLKYHYFDYNLSENKILVRTRAASLNFKDVLLAMKMLNIEKKELGIEFSGIVEKVGESSKFKVGDEVYGISTNCLGSHVIASEYLVVKKPSNISFEQAASIPVVFLTTYWALIYKANIQAEQLALVHSAAGGVGHAAIQLLQWKKAQVVATVGSEKKRKMLQERYGITHFADSHSPSWDAEVMKQYPEGVDIVLNSLNGVNIDKGLRCLRSGGNFIEIGKRDILENNGMALNPFMNNLTYFSVQLDMLFETHQKQLGNMLQEISKLFEQNVLSTFIDSVYPASKIVDAFKYMQSGKHMGKIVVRFAPEDYPVEIQPSVQAFAHNKTYVLSGGMGALGFELAKWMVSQGARYLILFSRSANKLRKEHIRGLEQMKMRGAHVHISNTNVANAAEVEQCFASIQGLGFPPVAGMIHLAMVLDDDPIQRQNAERFARVEGPKVSGAKNMVQSLLKFTKPQDVDFVIFFSSVSSIIGNPEQSNYVSANAFLDAYSNYLVNQIGLNAKTINLGAVDDVGICATDYKLRKIMAARGLENSIAAGQVAEFIKTSVLQDSPTQFITPFNIKMLCDFNASLRPKMAFLIKHQTEDKLLMDPNESSAQNIAKQIEKILQLDGVIDVNEKLTSYGVDSLLAVEISSMLGKHFGLKVSQMDILSGLTVAHLQNMMENK